MAVSRQTISDLVTALHELHERLECLKKEQETVSGQIRSVQSALDLFKLKQAEDQAPEQFRQVEGE
jgi:prefoldin subunit 5